VSALSVPVSSLSLTLLLAFVLGIFALFLFLGTHCVPRPKHLVDSSSDLSSLVLGQPFLHYFLSLLSLARSPFSEQVPLLSPPPHPSFFFLRLPSMEGRGSFLLSVPVSFARFLFPIFRSRNPLPLSIFCKNPAPTFRPAPSLRRHGLFPPVALVRLFTLILGPASLLPCKGLRLPGYSLSEFSY